MVINLLYTRENYISNFWELFFRSCGIWINKKAFKNGMVRETVPELMVLDKDTFMGNCWIQGQEEAVPCRVYLVTGVSDSDIAIAKDKIQNTFFLQSKDRIGVELGMQLIDKLFGEETEHENLKQLFEIYAESQLWETDWLFEEFARERKSPWDKLISNTCEEAIDKIDKILMENDKNIYAQYLKYYCEYIKIVTQKRTLMWQTEQSSTLLEELMELPNDYMENACFQYLAGRICEVSWVENKQAVYYLEKAAKSVENTELFYEIGHVYEKVFGEEELALQFYKKACQIDRNNYRAIYKLASGFEIKKRWLDAFGCYIEVVNTIKDTVEYNYKNGDAGSFRELDYYLKACIRITNLCRQNIADNEGLQIFQKREKDIRTKYVAEKYFENIMLEFKLLQNKTVPTVTNENALQTGEMSKQVKEELENKFQGECYR